MAEKDNLTAQAEAVAKLLTRGTVQHLELHQAVRDGNFRDFLIRQENAANERFDQILARQGDVDGDQAVDRPGNGDAAISDPHAAT